jgi:hypothetical protein
MTDDPGDVDLGTSPTPELHDVKSRNWPATAAVLALVLLLAVAVGYLARRLLTRPPPSAPIAADRAAPQRGAATPESVNLPPLDQSDAFVREMVGKLSSHPVVAAWLTTDGLLLNFAHVTRQIADGENPMRELGALGKLPPFKTVERRGRIYIDASSYQRYTRYADAVSALDARGAARLYETLKPRVGDAYRRMGDPEGDFDPVLERAIVEVLEIPVVQGEVELEPKGIVYGFADPDLERLTAAQKHLLRMGPQNLRAVQRKLREIADYLGIPASRLPPPKA